MFFFLFFFRIIYFVLVLCTEHCSMIFFFILIILHCGKIKEDASISRPSAGQTERYSTKNISSYVQIR